MPRLRLWRQKIKQHPFIAAGIILALLALIVLIIAVVLSNGTGFTGYTIKSTATETTLSPQTKVTTTAQSQPGKTLWDLLQLLATLAIPIIVGFGVAWFTAQQGKVSERENKDNQREKALQDYIDKMSELLLEQNLRGSSPEDEVRKIARVRTLTVLRGLDPIHKATVLQFLYESGLIDKDKRIIDLKDANLREAYLTSANLSRADLSGVILTGAKLGLTDLSGAILVNADLRGVILGLSDLRQADLSNAKLNGANLIDAKLSNAVLANADLSAVLNVNLSVGRFMKRAILLDVGTLSRIATLAQLSMANVSEADLNKALSEADLNKVWSGTKLTLANVRKISELARPNLANLSKADLGEIWRGAKLNGADLGEADLTRANLHRAIVTAEQLDTAKSLQNTTMPDGSKHS